MFFSDYYERLKDVAALTNALKTTLQFFKANADGSEISGHLYEQQRGAEFVLN